VIRATALMFVPASPWSLCSQARGLRRSRRLCRHNRDEGAPTWVR